MTQVVEAALRPLVARWRRHQVFRALNAWSEHVVTPLRAAKMLEQDFARRQTARALVTWQQNAQTAVALRATVLKIMMSSTRVCMYAWRTHVGAMKQRKTQDAAMMCAVVREWRDLVVGAHHRHVHARALGRHLLCSLTIKAWARVCMWNAHIDAKRDSQTMRLTSAAMCDWRINIRVQSKRFGCLLHFITGMRWHTCTTMGLYCNM
jgi:hypothetical protein